ncbi:MAG: hypothetical protein LUO87_04595 [Methanomicrobiales archaeon]|nr:hypothetical protein [Methanomicrobiales archaeon]
MDNLEITPAGDLQLGDPVTVRGIVDLGSDTFTESNKLEFYTQLDRPTVHWEWAIGIDDKYPPVTTGGGQYLNIQGWLLSYKEGTRIKVQVTMDGVVPMTIPSGELVVFRVRELDEDEEVVGTEVLREKNVFNPAEFTQQIATMEESLVSLKADIDAKAAAGISVGDAQTYYNEADDAISSAKSATGADVAGYLSTAENAISEATTAMDQAWAQQTIDQAQQVIDSVIGLYNEFTVNRSLKASDSRLVPITNKRDIAISSLSNAKDQQAAGSYASARAKAIDARTRADEAWNLSLDLKKELDSGFSLGFDLGGLLLPVAIVLLIVIVVGGVYYWKKYRTWDELG